MWIEPAPPPKATDPSATTVIRRSAAFVALMAAGTLSIVDLARNHTCFTHITRHHVYTGLPLGLISLAIVLLTAVRPRKIQWPFLLLILAALLLDVDAIFHVGTKCVS